MAWFKKKKICNHCYTNKTRREFEGRPICSECELEIHMGREEKYFCPKDGKPMVKEVLEGTEIIVDKCSECGAVFLDKNELEEIIEHGDDFALGLSVGISTGAIGG